MKRGSGVAEAKIASWLFRLCSAIVASLPENELTDVGCSLSSGRCYRIVAHNFDYCPRCSIRADYLSNVNYLQWKILHDGWVISGIAELCWPDAKCLQKKKVLESLKRVFRWSKISKSPSEWLGKLEAIAGKPTKFQQKRRTMNQWEHLNELEVNKNSSNNRRYCHLFV